MRIYNEVHGDCLKFERRSDAIQIIPHICNDAGLWGRGFVLALAQKWPQTREQYMQKYHSSNPYGDGGVQLGSVQWICVEGNVYVANMIAQKGIQDSVLHMDHPDNHHQVNMMRPPIRYGALAECMRQIVPVEPIELDIEIHCPRFGSGLAGGEWSVIRHMIWEIWCDNGLQVFVYDGQTVDPRFVTQIHTPRQGSLVGPGDQYTP